mmetsp:Transcript_75218/g.243213  ORF Transcript_75218/g.243213 Transcript_75218/m.243213 type:complete len:369 (-) Transcript_75218:42-1148(-)
MLAALRSEAAAYSYFLGAVRQLAFDPVVRAKTTVSSFFGGFFGIALRELLSSSQCRTCEEVVEEACGKGNFTGLKGKVAIITGASNGLGLENARCLMKYGCHVIWAVRNPEKAQAVLKKLEEKEGKLEGKATILKIELSDLTSIKPFADSFLALNLPLHYLICNAGIMSPTTWVPSKQNYESMFATNNLSHFLLTELLVPKLKETAASAGEARVVILSSLAAGACYNLDPAKLPCPKEEYDEMAEYCVSKAVDCLHARHIQEHLGRFNIVGCAVHPGIIETGLGAGNMGITALLYCSRIMAPFRKPVVKGSATTLYCALSSDVSQHAKEGKFFFYNCGPQYAPNIMSAQGDIVERVHARQLELVRPFM